MRFQTTDSYSRAVITAPTDNFTVVALVRLHGAQLSAAFSWVLSHGTPAATNSWSVGIEFDASGNAKGMAAVAHNVGLLTTAGGALPKQQWLVLGWQRNATVWQYLRDGVFTSLNAGTGTPGAASGTTYFNRTATSSNAGIAGDIAYIAQWNRVLTPAEHLYLGQYGSPLAIPQSQMIFNLQNNDPVDVGPNAYDIAVSNGNPGPGERFATYFFGVGAATHVSPPLNDDSATVLVDIQPSSADVADVSDSATVYIDIQVSSTDTAQFVDSVTVPVDLQVESFECHIKWQPTFFGTFSEKWSADMTPKWAFAGAAKWSATMSYGTVADEC